VAKAMVKCIKAGGCVGLTHVRGDERTTLQNLNLDVTLLAYAANLIEWCHVKIHNCCMYYILLLVAEVPYVPNYMVY
jgi:hypothetical protein